MGDLAVKQSSDPSGYPGTHRVQLPVSEVLLVLELEGDSFRHLEGPLVDDFIYGVHAFSVSPSISELLQHFLFFASGWELRLDPQPRCYSICHHIQRTHSMLKDPTDIRGWY